MAKTSEKPPKPSDTKGMQVVSTRRYEAPAPENLNTEIVDPENAIATTKEEEWITKKKTELTTTRQIETRVKRQVVLEDGKVVEDSGPMITTNTTEDTEQHQHQQTEHRQIGDGEPDSAVDGDSRWVAVKGPSGLVKEVKEHWTKSREEKEERTETEDVQHLGDITDEAFLSAIKSKESDVRQVLNRVSGQEVALSNLGSRLIHQSSKTRKVIDTEDTRHLSQVKEDGHLVTETQKTVQHEEINDNEVPDDGKGSDEDFEETRESSRHFKKTKDQELVEYLSNGRKIGQQIRYEAENVEGDRHGDPATLEMEQQEWDSLSARIRKLRKKKQLMGLTNPEREALRPIAKKPLDFEIEEETRKVETSRWLENHFGSESRSSKDSFADEDEDEDKGVKKSSSSFINVTMKSASGKPSKYVSSTSENVSKSRLRLDSPEVEEPPKNGYFRGVSEWKTRSPTQLNQERYQSNSNYYSSRQYGSKPSIERAQSFTYSSPTSPIISSPVSETPEPRVGATKERYSYSRRHAERNASGSRSELDSSPLYSTVQKRIAAAEELEAQKPQPHRTWTPTELKTPSPPYSSHKEKVEVYTNGDSHSRASHQTKEYSYRSWDRRQKNSHRYDPDTPPEDEPLPDYSPTTEHRERTPTSPSPSPSPSALRPETPDHRRKSHQKTRFAADNPPPHPPPPIPHEAPEKTERKSGLGQSFRKIIGKFRSSSSERKGSKDKKRKESFLKKLRSPSETNGGHVGEKGGYVTSEVIDDLPVAPPRARVSRQSSKARADYRMEERSRGVGSPSPTPGQRQGHAPVVNKYYLGEDPFNGSMYGKEKEYDGVTPYRNKHRSSHSQQQYRSYVSSSSNNHSSSTLGRHSKSTSRLINGDSDHYQNGHIEDFRAERGGIQTLPRKLTDEHRVKKQVYVTKSNGEYSPRMQNGYHSDQRSGSMFNVSIINQHSSGPSSHPIETRQIVNNGPAKPARTYRSSLLRSKSFNVHGDPYESNIRSSIYTSNPQLSTLDETPAPLKSPGIVTSISRSTKNLVDAIAEEAPTKTHRFSENRFSENRFSENHTNGYHKVEDSSHETKRKVFMKGLYDRAPELFKTIKSFEEENRSGSETGKPLRLTSTPVKNGYSSSFEYSSSGSPVNGATYRTTVHSPLLNGEEKNRSVVRRGSNDDYSETVRITSKSTDPLRPSVTNTVKNFSKKTIPNKDGKPETIESTDVKTVTKSHYRSNNDSVDYHSPFYSSNHTNKYSSDNGRLVVPIRNGH